MIEFGSKEEANSALEYSGTDLDGRIITVEIARPRGDRPQGAYGGVGGRGGGRGGSPGGKQAVHAYPRCNGSRDACGGERLMGAQPVKFGSACTRNGSTHTHQALHCERVTISLFVQLQVVEVGDVEVVVVEVVEEVAVAVSFLELMDR